MQLLDCKIFFLKLLKTEEASISKINSKINNNKKANMANIAKELPMLDEKYTKTQQATEKCERCHENKFILEKTIQAAKPVSLDFMLVYVYS